MPVPGGDRRAGGAASRGPSIPRCGVSSPFRGHLSTKSNAFCIGQSSRLSDQFRIRDHMLTHYNKIIAAKAAVDCSVPKSMTKSIKYNDQQRRERLKKVVTHIERDSLPSRASSSRPNSRESLDSVLQQKDLYDGYINTLRRSPYSDPGASPTSYISSPRHFHSSDHGADFRRRHLNLSGASSRMGCSTTTHKFQDNRAKTYSGDLIEKHAHHFTNKQSPFIPRTLKTQAKSALAQSRFYTPPRRKRREVGAEAEVQTDLSSFRDRHGAADTSLDGGQVEDPENSPLSDEEEETDRHRLSASRMSYDEFKSPSPTMQRIHSTEEELAYLEFVADVTNEILSLGLFSDRILNRVFERHLEENRHRLDEGKMRHLLDILRADLDSKDEKKLDLFVDHNFSNTRHFKDQFFLSHAINDGLRSQDFPVEDYRSKLRYLHGKEDEPHLQDDSLNGLSGEDHLGPSLTCLDEGDLPLNVLRGQKDFATTPVSTEAVKSPQDELDTSQPKDDFLSLQDNHEESYSKSQDNTARSEKTSPVDDLHEDSDANQKSLNGLLELDHDLNVTSELRDLEGLEQSFADIVHVSRTEDRHVHEEETETVPSDHEDIYDQDDF